LLPLPLGPPPLKPPPLLRPLIPLPLLLRWLLHWLLLLPPRPLYLLSSRYKALLKASSLPLVWQQVLQLSVAEESFFFDEGANVDVADEVGGCESALRKVVLNVDSE
jgi:hypothetical protein